MQVAKLLIITETHEAKRADKQQVAPSEITITTVFKHFMFSKKKKKKHSEKL